MPERHTCVPVASRLCGLGSQGPPQASGAGRDMTRPSSGNQGEIQGRWPEEATDPPSEWWLDRGAARMLFRHLKQITLSCDALEQEIVRLGDVHGRGVVYGEAIFLLTRLKLEPAEALHHWPRVLAHRTQLASRWGHPVDLRVGLMSYFLDVERHLNRPTVVEMDWIERAAASAYVDEVTGLPNHRFFRDQLRREIDRSLREGTPVSLILADADDFKAVNDCFGHEAGNEVLASLSRLLREGVQPGHVVARYGGEEFVVLLPSTPKAEAAMIAERLREDVASHQFHVKAGAAPLTLTISLGLATCPADARDDGDLISAADVTLYGAKAAGKNRVGLFGASTRSYARRRVACGGNVRCLGSVEYPAQTIEVGEGGLSFHSECPVDLETLIEVTLGLGPGDEVQLAGRVVWTRPVDAGGYETAIRFIERGHPCRERLVRWLGVQQWRAPASPPFPIGSRGSRRSSAASGARAVFQSATSRSSTSARNPCRSGG